ncbi:MAG: ABC transporter substrate-binding protein [Hyphomicrobiales bacterium]
MVASRSVKSGPDRHTFAIIRMFKDGKLGPQGSAWELTSYHEDTMALTRRTHLKASAALAASAVLAPVTRFAAAATERPTLNVGVQANPDTLEPGREYSNASWRVHANMYDTLIGMDVRNSFKLVPGLATAWRRVDDKTIELTLREGVKFHNGDVLTAEDVAFTFGPERMSSEKAPTYALTRPTLGRIEKVEAIGPMSVRVTARGPDPLLERRVAHFPAQIINKRAYLEAKDFDSWSRSPVGTGPFRIEDWRIHDYILLEAFDEYWGGKPTVRALKFRVIPDTSSRVAGLKAGEFGIVTDIPPDQFSNVASYPGLEVAGGPIVNHRVLVFDTTNPILKDVRIRHALSFAIDREAIVKALWDGRVGIPRSHQWPAFGDLYFPDWPKPAYDPEKARALVKEAGYQRQQIEYRTWNDYYTNEIATAQVLVEMWKAVGLNVNLSVKETTPQVYAPEGRGIRNWSNSMVYPDPLGALWRLYGAGSVVQTGTKEWTNQEFNELGHVLETSLDTPERQRAWRRMLDIYDNDDPCGTVLHEFGIFYGKRKDIGWTPLPVEWMDFRPGSLMMQATSS